MSFMACTTLRNSGVRGCAMVRNWRCAMASAWPTTSPSGRRIQRISQVPTRPATTLKNTNQASSLRVPFHRLW